MAALSGSLGADEARQSLDFLAARRFTADGMLSDVVPLADLANLAVRSFERLPADRSLVKVAVAP